MCAASLAHHGLLSSVNELYLRDVDLSPVAAQHMASLTSCVPTDLILIINVSGFGLVSLLSTAKCTELGIFRQSLEREETWALVQAMESRVKMVWLDTVTLDIETLTEYSGQGVCREVWLMDDTAATYREEMRTWARSRKWRLMQDDKINLRLSRL